MRRRTKAEANSGAAWRFPSDDHSRRAAERRRTGGSVSDGSRCSFTTSNQSAKPWALDTCTSVSTTPGSTSTRQYACFDWATGNLLATRKLGSGVPARTDLLTLLKRDSGRFVTNEASYGGDETLLSAASVAMPLRDYTKPGTRMRPRPPRARLPARRVTYASGTRVTSTPYTSSGTALPFKTLDLEVDGPGLPTTVYDTAGVATAYEFDPSARIRKITPAGVAAITYSFSEASASQGAKVEATQTAAAGEVLRKELLFDSMGRPVVERRNVGTATLRERTTKYNGSGWKTSVCEWGVTVKLAAPAAADATRVSGSEILVTWFPSPGAAQYRVERRSGTFTTVQTVAASVL